jgi:hypothetical protein
MDESRQLPVWTPNRRKSRTFFELEDKEESPIERRNTFSVDSNPAQSTSLDVEAPSIARATLRSSMILIEDDTNPSTRLVVEPHPSARARRSSTILIEATAPSTRLDVEPPSTRARRNSMIQIDVINTADLSSAVPTTTRLLLHTETISKQKRMGSALSLIQLNNEDDKNTTTLPVRAGTLSAQKRMGSALSLLPLNNEDEKNTATLPVYTDNLTVHNRMSTTLSTSYLHLNNDDARPIFHTDTLATRKRQNTALSMVQLNIEDDKNSKTDDSKFTNIEISQDKEQNSLASVQVTSIVTPEWNDDVATLIDSWNLMFPEHLESVYMKEVNIHTQIFLEILCSDIIFFSILVLQSRDSFSH